MVPLHENPSQISSSEIPVQIPTQIPIQIPIQIPSQIPVQLPTQIPIQIPIQVPTQIPIENSIQLLYRFLTLLLGFFAGINRFLATRCSVVACGASSRESSPDPLTRDP